jgi:hypothetical protein
MRQSESQRAVSKTSQSGLRPSDHAVPCNERAYLESFYAATARSAPRPHDDRHGDGDGVPVSLRSPE